MKTRITATIIFFISTLFLTATCFSQTSLKGKIVDSLTNQPLIGAIIFISDINAGTTSDSVGEYQLTNLPTGSFVVTVSYLGFITRSQLLNLSKNEVIHFALPETIIESKEAIVTGVSKAMEAQRSPLSIQLIGTATLLQTTSTNIVDALAHQAGISQITTGGSISKPVIRGL